MEEILKQILSEVSGLREDVAKINTRLAAMPTTADLEKPLPNSRKMLLPYYKEQLPKRILTNSMQSSKSLIPVYFIKKLNYMS